MFQRAVPGTAPSDVSWICRIRDAPRDAAAALPKAGPRKGLRTGARAEASPPQAATQSLCYIAHFYADDNRCAPNIDRFSQRVGPTPDGLGKQAALRIEWVRRTGDFNNQKGTP